MINNGLEHSVHVVVQILMIHAGDAVQRTGIDYREVKLLIGGTKVVEQVKHLIHHPIRAGTRTVNFVHDHNRVQARCESFLSHETGLRHGAVDGIHHQQHTVHHTHYTLYFTTKVSVARGVYDIDVVVFPF